MEYTVRTLKRRELTRSSSQKLIHTFDGWESPVCTIVQSPAVDVVAVGLMDGRIIMHNLKLDKTLFTFRQTGMVSGISFRTGLELLVVQYLQ